MTAFVSYAESPSEGQVGHIASSSSGYTGRTLVRATDAAINHSLAVCPGTTAGKTVKAPTTAAEVRKVEGILLDPIYLLEIGQAATSYEAGDPCTLLEEGEMWVNSEGTVAYKDPVYVRHTSDGGSNTTRGTLRNNSDGTVVIDTTATVEGKYSVVLYNGIQYETFTYSTDGTATADEITTGLVALINASANYNAAGTTECTITNVVGGEINIVHLEAPTAAAVALYTVTDNQKATRLAGAHWSKARTGAGKTKIKLDLPR